MGHYLNTVESAVNENLVEGEGELSTRTVGGFPISAYDHFSHTGDQKGGAKTLNIEGIAKISHLYIPLGLVMFSHPTSNCQNIYKNTEADVLDDRMLDKLLVAITKPGGNSDRKTRKFNLGVKPSVKTRRL